MHNTKEGSTRDLLREQQRLARHAQSQMAEDRSEANSFPLFGEPIKVLKSEEDPTTKRIRETLGEYSQAVNYFGNCSKPGSQRLKSNRNALSSSTAVNGESGNNHPDVISTQKSAVNGSFKLSNGSSAKELPVSNKQSDVPPPSKYQACANGQSTNANSRDKFSISSRERVNHFSNHDRTDVNSSHVQTHQNYDSDTPINRLNQPKHHNLASKENPLTVNINKANDNAKHNEIKDVESILQEMQCVVPTPLTAIGTPRNESNLFTFPVNANNLECNKKPSSEHCDNVNDTGNNNKDRQFASISKLGDDSRISDLEDDPSAEAVNSNEHLILSPPKESGNAENSSSDSSGSSSESDDSSSVSDSEDDEPAEVEIANQSDSSVNSVHSQHSNSSNNQSWNLASFIKPAQTVSNDSFLNGRSNRDSAPYDPVGDEGPFGSVQSILSSLSSTGEEDHQKLDPLSPVPALIKPLSCDKEKMNEMVANIAGQVHNMPSSWLLSPVPTPSHSSYADDQRQSADLNPPVARDQIVNSFGNKSQENETPVKINSKVPKTSVRKESKVSSDSNNKTKKSKKSECVNDGGKNDQIYEKSPKLNSPKIDKGKTTPSKANSSANKRRKSHKSKFKTAEFLSEDSSSGSASSDNENCDVDVLNTSSPVKLTTSVSPFSALSYDDAKSKSATKQPPKSNSIHKKESYVTLLSPLKNSPSYNGHAKSENALQSKKELIFKDLLNDVNIEPLSPISANSNHVSHSPVPSEKIRNKKNQIIVQLDLALIDRIPGHNVYNMPKDIEISEHEKENQDNSYLLVENPTKSKSDKKFEIQSSKEEVFPKSKSHKRKHANQDVKKEKKRHKSSAPVDVIDTVSKKEPSENEIAVNEKQSNIVSTQKSEITSIVPVLDEKCDDQKNKVEKRKEHKDKKKVKNVKSESHSCNGSEDKTVLSPLGQLDDSVKAKKSQLKNDSSKDSTPNSTSVKLKSVKTDCNNEVSEPSHPKDDLPNNTSSIGKKHKLIESNTSNVDESKISFKKQRKEGSSSISSQSNDADSIKSHKQKPEESKDLKRKHSDQISTSSSSQPQASTEVEKVMSSTNKNHHKQTTHTSVNRKDKSSHIENAKEHSDNHRRSSDYYLSEAKTLKHQADREENRTAQAMKYLEAVLYFILTGNAMESNRVTNDGPTYTMYKDTLTLIRFISSKFRSNHNSSMASADNKLAVLSLRVRSLLQLKLFQMKRSEIKDFQKLFSEFQKNPSKFMQSHTPNGITAKQLSQPSPGQQLSNGTCPTNWINGSKTTGTPSPLSPTPSPAGSVASVGSQSSGYSSSDIPSSQAKPYNASTSGANSTTVSSVGVPNPHFNSFLQTFTQQYTNLQHVASSHDLWEQADNLIVRTHCEDFFRELDQRCNKLTLHTSLTDLVKYVTEGLHQLKAN